MAEYIEREELEIALNHRLNFLMAEYGEYDHYTSGFDGAVTMVENFPATDVEPVKRGLWVPQPFGVTHIWRCSKCETIGSPQWNYCPKCGARMDEEVKHER